MENCSHCVLEMSYILRPIYNGQYSVSYIVNHGVSHVVSQCVGSEGVCLVSGKVGQLEGVEKYSQCIGEHKQGM